MKQNLILYSMQIAMLKQLLTRKLITEKEYVTVKNKLKKDYGVISDITT
ncbi:SHOCT domain-containing protein [Lentibacillus sp. N15]